MPIVEIDGVGRVELDDSFLELPQSQQDRVIQDIASQNRKEPPAPAAKPQAQPPAAAASEIVDPNAAALDAAGVDNMGGGSPAQFSNEWLAAQEAEYQQSLRDNGYVAEEANRPSTNPEKHNNFGSGVLGFSDAVTFGFDDEIDAGLGAILGGSGRKTIWDGEGFRSAFDHNVAANRKLKEEVQEEDFGSFLTGGLASIALPISAPNKILTAGRDIPKVVKAAEAGAEGGRISRYGKAAGAGAAYGGLYGLGTGEGDITDRLDEAAEYGLYGIGGGVLGEAVIGNAVKALPKVRDTRFAAREAERNPYAAYDAEVVQDLAAATRDRAVTPTDPKGRAGLTAKTINSVEQGYFAEFKNVINSMDIPEADKLKLKEALTGKYAIGTDRLDEIAQMGVEGKAVADAVIKVQRLRALTPELKTKTGWLTKTSNAMDFVPGIPGIVPRTLRGIARASGDGEAARVNAADKLLAREGAYNKLAEMVGPSGARESRDALWQKVYEMANAKDAEAARKAMLGEINAFDRQARPIIREKVKATAPDEWGTTEPIEVTEARKAMNRQAGRLATRSENAMFRFDDQLNAPAPEAKITAKDRKDLMRQIEDPTPDPRDLNNPVPDTEKALATRYQRRNAAISKLENNVTDWEQKLADPSTAPKPKAPKADAAEDAIDAMVERGVRGEGRAMSHYTEALGISEDDAIRVLDRVAEQNPELAPEIARLKLGHNTRNKRLGPTMRPLMRNAMDELEIKPTTASEAPRSNEAPVSRTIKIGQSKSAPDFELGDENPLNHHERIVEGGGVTVRPTSDGNWRISDLRAVERGGGRKALQAVIKQADEDGISIELTPEPTTPSAGKRMSQSELEKWYEGFGFQKNERGDMVRRPRSVREQELTKELDEVDPVTVTLADGSSSRASEVGILGDSGDPAELADLARANAIREELAAIRAEREQPAMRKVDRPHQWDQGRNRYVTQANDSIGSMMRDDRIGRESLEALGNAPAQIRDNFKTTEEAESYIVERVLPDLEASGIHPAEIQRVRSYLFEVAQAKPYATREQFEAGTSYRGPGRPRKTED